MLSFIVRLAAFAVGSLIGKWLALDLPDIIRERQHKKKISQARLPVNKRNCCEND